MISELDERFLRPSQKQLEKIVPQQISLSELQSKINKQSDEINRLNLEIVRLRNELINLIQAVK